MTKPTCGSNRGSHLRDKMANGPGSALGRLCLAERNRTSSSAAMHYYVSTLCNSIGFRWQRVGATCDCHGRAVPLSTTAARRCGQIPRCFSRKRPSDRARSGAPWSGPPQIQPSNGYSYSPVAMNFSFLSGYRAGCRHNHGSKQPANRALGL
jgi:hypothetical protein